MKTMKRIAQGTGKVVLAILVGVLIPVLIWVALEVAVNQKMRDPPLGKDSYHRRHTCTGGRRGVGRRSARTGLMKS